MFFKKINILIIFCSQIALLQLIIYIYIYIYIKVSCVSCYNMSYIIYAPHACMDVTNPNLAKTTVLFHHSTIAG